MIPSSVQILVKELQDLILWLWRSTAILRGNSIISPQIGVSSWSDGYGEGRIRIKTDECFDKISNKIIALSEDEKQSYS